MKRPLFDYIDRFVIRQWYNNLPESSFRRWCNKPLIVTQYELAKDKKQIAVDWQNTKLHKCIIKLLNYLTK